MIVTVPVADLRKEPSHRAERVSQALYGARVTVISEEPEFLKVRGDDNYQGWMARAYLQPSVEDQTGSFTVTSNFATFRLSSPEVGLTLPHGAVLDGYGDIKGYFDYRSEHFMQLFEGMISPLKELAISDPCSIALQFLSAPYLWGGTSPYGFDCSGLVQTVYRRAGMILPRDTVDQIRLGVPVETAELRPGDLIFFPGHVAINLEDGRIVHATRLRGMVVAESLNPFHESYRRDLADNVVDRRRVLN